MSNYGVLGGLSPLTFSSHEVYTQSQFLSIPQWGVEEIIPKSFYPVGRKNMWNIYGYEYY